MLPMLLTDQLLWKSLQVCTERPLPASFYNNAAKTTVKNVLTGIKQTVE